MQHRAGRATFRRTRPQALAAVLLALSGASAILYAAFLPIPPLSDVPVPVVLQALGVTTLLAAVGVYLGQTWGRWLGVLITLVSLALAIGRMTSSISAVGTPWGFLNYVVDFALGGLVLWLLLRRWPTHP
jgi:hypothetical protein